MAPVACLGAPLRRQASEALCSTILPFWSKDISQVHLLITLAFFASPPGAVSEITNEIGYLAITN